MWTWVENEGLKSPKQKSEGGNISITNELQPINTGSITDHGITWNTKHGAIRLSKRKLILKLKILACDTTEDTYLHTVSQADNSQLANMYSLQKRRNCTFQYRFLSQT